MRNGFVLINPENSGKKYEMAYLKGDVLNGQKYPQDYAKALPLLRQAADLGSVNAQIEVGVLLYNGNGIPWTI